jgi:4-amino-4-deoxy-L-arabinose transferase
MRYALCWLAFPFLLLSMSQGKLGTYVLPCFAPLSLLFALGLTYRSKVSESRLFRAIALTCAVGAGLTAGVIAVVHFLNLAPGAIFSASETWKWIVGSAALAASSAIYVVSARAKSTMMSVYCFAAAPLTLMLSAHFIVPGQMLKSRAPEGFIERCAGSIDQGHQIYSTNYLAPAVCWVLKRTDIGILGRGGELQYGLNYPDAKNRQIQIPELAKRIDDGNRTTGIILVITERDYSRFRRYLPEASLMEKANGFVFLKYVSPLEHSRKP